MAKGELTEKLRLYVITDERPDVDSLLSAVQASLQGGATVVQLRRKHEDGGRFVETGRAIRRLTREHGAWYIVNDRIDVAILTEADGVHVGQSDVNCRDARRLMGDKVIGVSARTLEEAIQAERDGADYIGVGSLYPTVSKSDAELCSLSTLKSIAASVSIPIVGIGGISVERVEQVMSHGAHGVAVVSAVMSALSPERSATQFREALRGALGRTEA